jgi:hypothetical protein
MDFNQEIKKRINEKFPNLDVSIFPDETQDNVIVAIDDDLYYSDEYLEVVMDIKLKILWENNIFNYLFVRESAKPSFIPVLFTNIHIPVSPFSFNNNAATEAISFSRINYSDSSSDGDYLWPMVA